MSKNSDRSKKHSTKRQTVSAVGWVGKPIIRMTPEKLTTILDASFRKAKMDITRRSPTIEELIATVQDWLNGEDPEGESSSN